MAMSDQSGIDQRRVLACQIVAAMQEMLDAGAPRAFHGRLTDARSNRFPECLRLFEDQGRGIPRRGASQVVACVLLRPGGERREVVCREIPVTLPALARVRGG